MNDDKRIKQMIIAGLLLAFLAAGFFLYSKQQNLQESFFGGNKSNQQVDNNVPSTEVNPSVLGDSSSPQPSASASPMAAAQGGTGTGSNGPKGSNVASLPSTGVPIALLGVASASAVVSGWFLRRYPR